MNHRKIAQYSDRRSLLLSISKQNFINYYKNNDVKIKWYPKNIVFSVIPQIHTPI